MPKTKTTVEVALPAYVAPRTRWRRLIYAAALRAMREKAISYRSAPSLALKVTLRLAKHQLPLHDVDNRLKDIMDALQGCLGGAGKKKRICQPLIPNDSHVFRVLIEKVRISPKAAPGGRLKITRFSMPPLLRAELKHFRATIKGASK